jgi:tetratricopeptide (TPR) repeat protein
LFKEAAGAIESEHFKEVTRWLAKSALLVLLCTLCALADYIPDPRYKQADDLLGESRFVKARELGEAMLKEDPNSFEAQTILGRVHLLGEGNPGKADYYFRKARRTITERFRDPSTRNGPWRCYGDLLWNLRNAAMDLEDYEQALEWVTEYNEAYPHAAVPERYGWPLMKLGRMDEARERMAKARENKKDNDDAVNTILNTIGAVEYEISNFEESLAAYEEIVRRVESGKGEKDPVFYSNAAEASRDLLDYPSSEKYLLKSTKYLHSYSYSTPWLDLAELYIGQGRQPEAIQALERHSHHLARCKPAIQNQKRATSQAILGMTLMACGHDAEARQLLQEVARHGDRNSGTSTKRSLVRSRNQFFYREALKQQRERIREERSYGDLKDWPSLYWEDLRMGRQIEAARRECAALAITNDGPRAMLRPYGPKGFNCPWLTPALWEVFGSGVISVEAEKMVEAMEGDPTVPYILSILAEATGDEDMMKDCLEKLPPSQVLLRGRLHALLARSSGSAESLQQALEADPPVIRRLSMSLPVQIQCSDGTVQSMLASSPRFRSGTGFQLVVDGAPSSGYRGHLQGPDGSVLTRFESSAGEDEKESRRLLCETVHQTVFAPRVNLTQADINGLDGSNLAGGRFREQLKDIVGVKPDKESEK